MTWHRKSKFLHPKLRANLEVIIARDIFGFSKEDMEYILSTFIYGNPDRELMDMILDIYT